VLILGCGYGRDAKYMASQGLTVTAVDFAREGIKLARSWTTDDNSTEVNFVLDNIVDLDLPDACFDAVFSHRTLHLLISVDRLERGLAQIHRILKPGGHACISVRNPRDPSKMRSQQLSGGTAELSFRPGHKVLYLNEAEFTEVVGRQFNVLDFQEMSERESESQDYDVKLHYVVLEKKPTSQD
jgi:SAM-dependent methyltransferase